MRPLLPTLILTTATLVAPMHAAPTPAEPRVARSVDDAEAEASGPRLAPEAQLEKMRVLTVGSVAFLGVVGAVCIAWAIRERRRPANEER